MEPKQNLGMELRTILNLLCRQQGMDQKKCFYEEITPVQVWVLDFLFANQDKEIYQKDLEHELQVRRSTATGILQGMEKKGFIVRESVSHDARLKKLVLTSRVAEIHKDISIQQEEMEARLMQGISKEEKEMLFQILEKIKRNLSNE